jgi:hypothetical protein
MSSLAGSGSREVYGRQGASHLDIRKGTGGGGIGRKRFGGVIFSFICVSERGGDLGVRSEREGVFFYGWRLVCVKPASTDFSLPCPGPGGLDIISDEKPVTPGDGRERRTESNCVPFKESNRYGGKNGFCYLELSNVVTYWSGTSSRGRHGKRGQNLGVEKVVNPYQTTYATVVTEV